jgi:hypothetical protein
MYLGMHICIYIAYNHKSIYVYVYLRFFGAVSVGPAALCVLPEARFPWTVLRGMSLSIRFSVW